VWSKNYVFTSTVLTFVPDESLSSDSHWLSVVRSVFHQWTCDDWCGLHAVQWLRRWWCHTLHSTWRRQVT